MLYINLFFTLVLLVALNLLFSKLPKSFLLLFFVVSVLCVSPLMLLLGSLTGVLQFLALASLAIFCFCWKQRKLFMPLSIVTCAGIYIASSWFAIHQLNLMQSEIRYVSLANRVRPVKETLATTIVSDEAAKSLLDLEEVLASRDPTYGIDNYREWRLKRLHEETVMEFINSPGFGVGRMDPRTELDLNSSKVKPILQPSARATAEWVADFPYGTLSEKKPTKVDGLRSMHKLSILDFVNAPRFGYYKDRHHVAGFEEHRFRQTPEPSEPWKLLTVELIGLVVHEKPVVYVSDYLPRMDKLRNATTRPLDEIEKQGLKYLHQGNDLFVQDKRGGRRFIGAVRALKQCINCHHCKRGDLLGAFCYTLVRRSTIQD